MRHKDKVTIVDQKQVENKRVLTGSKRPHPNQRCFEINETTGECDEASYRSTVNFLSADRKEVDTKENCVYIIALNKENALKKYRKS